MREIQATPPKRPAPVAIVASRFNQFVVDQLLEGAKAALSRHGVPDDQVTLVWVPGAYELPLAADRLAANGRYGAIVALGAVIRGGTPHFDYVADACSTGLLQTSLKWGVPVSFGVLTTDTVEQALERADVNQGNKGFDVTLAALEMMGLVMDVVQPTDQCHV